MLGVRAGTGVVEGSIFGIGLTKIGRLAHAAGNLETAHQNVLSRSIFIMKTDYQEAIISAGLARYETADLQKLFEVIGEKASQPTG
jgi:hypothetical protein